MAEGVPAGNESTAIENDGAVGMGTNGDDENGLIIQARMLAFLEGFMIRDLQNRNLEGAEEEDRSLSSLDSSDRSELVYLEQVRFMKDNDRSTLYVDFSHLLLKDHVLADGILGEYYRYTPYIHKAVQAFVRKTFPDYVTEEKGNDREFFVSFYNLPNVELVRGLRTDKVGRLCSISGTVTRSSEVRPELLFGAFECHMCGTMLENVEQQFKFTPPLVCTNVTCKNVNKWELLPERSKFVDWQKLRVQENANEVPAGSMPRSVDVILRHEIVERAKPGDKCVFTGTLIVIPDVSQLRAAGEAPGLQSSRGGRKGRDRNGEGVTGLKSLGVRELSYRLAFLACGVHTANGRFGGTISSTETFNHQTTEQILTMLLQQQQEQQSMEEETSDAIRDRYSEDEVRELRLMASQPNLLAKMRRSVAPTVFGHEDIKLGILLMLFGGVHKKTKEGIKLRGDINVCIVGDPSTAKSQFLKYVCSFLPRAIYTSGKASSAAGLTASVVKDPETGEFCIEAGALMLADNGICCIDEFDKMDDVDQVAIHEAMEQQTISITKAGIQATLNARTSVLAAANPIHGRYDRSKTLKANLQLSPAIMSRFDLFFVVLDECDEDQDRVIAEHIVRVHQRRIALLLENRDPEEFENLSTAASTQSQPETQTFSTSQLQSYIRYARTIDPIIPPEIQPKLVECYRKLRQGDAIGQNRTAYRITVRQLEALIRLAEAIARLHLDDFVRPRYVDWSFHLLRTSIVHVDSADVRFDDPGIEAEPGSALEPRARLTQHANDDDDGQSDEDDGSSDASDVSMSGESEAIGSIQSGSRPVKSKRGKDDAMSVSFDEYTRIANMLVVFLRQKESESNETGRHAAVHQKEVVKYYLTQCEDISSEEQLVRARKLINQIIKRLVEKDNTLMRVELDDAERERILSRDRRPQDDDDSDDDDDDDDHDGFPEENTFLVVHPNHVID